MGFQPRVKKVGKGVHFGVMVEIVMSSVYNVMNGANLTLRPMCRRSPDAPACGTFTLIFSLLLALHLDR